MLKHHRAFFAILLSYLLLAAGYSAIVPLGETPDEADHYAYIVYLGQNHALPEGPAVTQSKHPPLYHATAALLTAWTGLDFTFLRSNPDALPLGPNKPPNLFIHTTLEAFPWRDGALALHLARALSVLLGGVTLWATWRMARELFADQPDAALAAAAFLAGLPGFLFISGSANNDSAAGALGALLLWLCARTLRLGLSQRRTLGLGVVLGLGLLAKVGTLALWPLVALTTGGAWALMRREHATPQRSSSLIQAAAHSATAYGLGALLAAPWLLRNWRLYGDPFGWSLVRATVDQRVGPIGPDVALWLLRGFYPTFWGRFGAAGQVSLPQWVYLALAAVTAALVVGAVVFVRRLGRLNLRTALVLALPATAPLLMFVSIYRYSAIALGTDQARLMWPALAALAVWVGVGVVGISGKRAARGVAIFAVLMSLLGLGALLSVVRPGFAPPAPAAAAFAPVPLLRFGDLELLAVELPAVSPAPGYPITVRLLWRASAPISADLRPALRLVHQDGWLAAEWSHSPAGGRYSTDRWRVDEVVGDDYVLLPQPATAGRFMLEVGVRSFGGDWLPPSNSPGPFAPLGVVEFQ